MALVDPIFQATLVKRGADFVDVSMSSRFGNTPLYGSGDDLHWGRWRRPELLFQRSAYTTYQIIPACDRRPDLLAYSLYGDSTLWWIICDLNDIVYPMEEFLAGRKIVILSPDVVRRALTEREIFRGED